MQRLTTQTDQQGFQIEKWKTYSKTRAKVDFDDRLMREVFADRGTETTVVRIFTFRYQQDISEKTDRILYNGKPYEIYGINNINEENRFLKVWGRQICQ